MVFIGVPEDESVVADDPAGVPDPELHAVNAVAASAATPPDMNVRRSIFVALPRLSWNETTPRAQEFHRQESDRRTRFYEYR
ncbi:hypothetical protein ACGFYV_30830 [Streptomyces sp. NPDC048297]|uniref:hypothetical protein n=1 Tax=Streptomyces sp. NPDC048297 TaxID=3365531 RepID=UPI00372237E7